MAQYRILCPFVIEARVPSLIYLCVYMYIIVFRNFKVTRIRTIEK